MSLDESNPKNTKKSCSGMQVLHLAGCQDQRELWAGWPVSGTKKIPKENGNGAFENPLVCWNSSRTHPFPLKMICLLSFYRVFAVEKTSDIFSGHFQNVRV